MSYSIHNTEGLIISFRPLREADRVYSILTRDLGLIRATAIGVRKDASKLRGSLEPLTLSAISLVRGKEYWRITSAEVIQEIKSEPAVLRPLILLEKLVQGESAHPEIFDAVKEMILSRKPEDEMFEVRFVATILFHLGYLNREDLTLPKPELIKAINNGLDASHLTTS
jgi:DNA repair protein RecO (recombination protein O)